MNGAVSCPASPGRPIYASTPPVKMSQVQGGLLANDRLGIARQLASAAWNRLLLQVGFRVSEGTQGLLRDGTKLGRSVADLDKSPESDPSAKADFRPYSYVPTRPMPKRFDSGSLSEITCLRRVLLAREGS